MRAVVCKAWGPPETLSIEDLPSPLPRKGQVVVSVQAAGVNFPDVLIIQGQYQVKPELPFSPGSEIAGTVKAVGEGVQHVQPGDRVAAFLTWGGYAEEVVVDADRVVPVPAHVDPKIAASFMLAYGTAYHALKDRAQLQSGETLLVLGAAGGVGLAAVEIGKLMGARVIAAASSPEKLAVCREHGADAIILYEREDLREALKRLTDGKGVHVVYDPVGGRFAEPALRSVTWEGRYLVVGFASGEIPKIPLNLPLLKGSSLVGVFWGEFARHHPEANARNLGELLAWIGNGRLQPLVSATYPLERAADALTAMAKRSVVGKIVLVTDGAG